ncbi:MAG: FHA domain-containing protein, partial [Deltaproteobacteria bacterium]|nr:FHA domain-containing protein [Deltaproteobacteria bacterium]
MGPVGDKEDSSLRNTRVTRTQTVVNRISGGTECLVAIYGVQVGRKFDIRGDTIRIGRDPETNDLVLEADSVSRRHARIRMLDGNR